MTYGHLRADCLYTGISSGPNARYRVWESLYRDYGKRLRPVCLANMSDVVYQQRIGLHGPYSIWRIRIRFRESSHVVCRFSSVCRLCSVGNICGVAAWQYLFIDGLGSVTIVRISVGWVRLTNDGLGWVGSWKMDPRPCLFGTSFQKEAHVFLKIPEFPFKRRVASLPKKTQLNLSSRFDSTATCDRHPDTDRQTHGHRLYRTSSAPRG